MGALPFCIYTFPIRAIIRYHGLKYHIYVDDTQVSLTFNVNQTEITLQKPNAYLLDIGSWMIANKLKINDYKTDFFINV